MHCGINRICICCVGFWRSNLLVGRINSESFIVLYQLLMRCQYRLWRLSLSIWQITSGTSLLSLSRGTNFKSSLIVSKYILQPIQGRTLHRIFTCLVMQRNGIFPFLPVEFEFSRAFINSDICKF